MLCFRFIHFRLISVMFQSPILHSPCNFRFGLVLFHFVLSILSVGFVCLERESAESLHVAYGYGYQYGYGLKSYAVHTREWMAHPHIHLTHWLQGWKLISYFRCGCCCYSFDSFCTDWVPLVIIFIRLILLFTKLSLRFSLDFLFLSSIFYFGSLPHWLHPYKLILSHTYTYIPSGEWPRPYTRKNCT